MDGRRAHHTRREQPKQGDSCKHRLQGLGFAERKRDPRGYRLQTCARSQSRNRQAARDSLSQLRLNRAGPAGNLCRTSRGSIHEKAPGQASERF